MNLGQNKLSKKVGLDLKRVVLEVKCINMGPRYNFSRRPEVEVELLMVLVVATTTVEESRMRCRYGRKTRIRQEYPAQNIWTGIQV